MASVYDLLLQSQSLREPAPSLGRPLSPAPRPGETSGERRLRVLRTVLGERRG